MLGNNQFENFIIKKIAKDITYDASSLSLKFNKIEVTESIMNIIRKEALNYHLTEEEITKSIENAIRRINQTTNKTIAYSNVQIQQIKLGQHFKLYLQDPSEEKREDIELLCTAPYVFLVLNSTDNSLQKEDKLISVSNIWTIHSGIEFSLFRYDTRYPNDKTVYRTSPFVAIEYYNPAPIFEIFDSDSDFEFTKKILFSEDKKLEKPIQMYAWYPEINNPYPAFTEAQFSSEENAPYIITFSPTKESANISCNEKWILNEYHYEQFFRYASRTYTFINEINKDKAEKKIKVIKRGILKRTLNTKNGEYIWIVQKKIFIRWD